jgi:hypothetical protein
VAYEARILEEYDGLDKVRARLAEPAQTADARGSKRRAKIDRTDARHLRQLLVEGRLPQSWIPPEHLAEHPIDHLFAGPTRQARGPR